MAALKMEQLQGMIEDAVKARLGTDAKPEEIAKVFVEMQAYIAKGLDIDRQNTSDLAFKADGDHPYLKTGNGLGARIVANDFCMVNGKRENRHGLGLRFARAVRAHAVAATRSSKGSPTDATDVAKEWGDEWLAEEIDKARQQRQEKLTGGLVPAATGGGAIVPVEHQRELIELLRSENVVRASGATQMPLEHGNLTMPRQNQAATATFEAENAAVNATDLDFDQVTLAAFRLTAVVPISNTLLVTNDPTADVIVRNDLVQVVANREDLAFIREPAGANNPSGIATILPGGQKQNQSGTTITAIAADVTALFELVEGADTPMNIPVWWFSSRTKNQLLGKVTVDEVFAFREELGQGTFFGWPFFLTNQIPNNLGGGTDESEMYFGDASEILIGDTRLMEVEVFPGGAYTNSGGTLVSGISRDETAFKITSAIDIDLRHLTSYALQEQVNL